MAAPPVCVCVFLLYHLIFCQTDLWIHWTVCFSCPRLQIIDVTDGQTGSRAHGFNMTRRGGTAHRSSCFRGFLLKEPMRNVAHRQPLQVPLRRAGPKVMARGAAEVTFKSMHH